MLEGISFRRERLAAAATDEFLAATDVADLLVRKGVPFREAHGVVAGLVRRALERGRPLSSLTREELAEHSPALDDEFYAVLGEGAWLESKASEGGTALPRVREQLERAHARLADGRRARRFPRRSTTGRSWRWPATSSGASWSTPAAPGRSSSPRPTTTPSPPATPSPA